MTTSFPAPHRIRAGMVGLGLIFNDTYRPFFQQVSDEWLYRRDFGSVEVQLTAVASRTGKRAEKLQQAFGASLGSFTSHAGEQAVEDLLRQDLEVVCVATPDQRHFEPARKALEAGKHVIIEKPSVLTLQELDTLQKLAESKGVLAKVIYHKLCDPDHKKLRTHVVDGTLVHVNNGYCTLLEPRWISSQFAEWIEGRNPATYVAVHYVKLIDFTFGPLWRLSRVTATGQRGLVGAVNGPTWDSVQLQFVYTYPNGREAAFDLHTNWVTPDNFPGYVEQEVQFRFDNAVWLAHQRKRGVEIVVEQRSPHEIKYTPNHHYNGQFLEPWGARSQRGYGIESVRHALEEIAYVEYGGPAHMRDDRLLAMRQLAYNDLGADRNTVAVVQALEAILARAANGQPGALVEVNGKRGGLVLLQPGQNTAEVLYQPGV